MNPADSDAGFFHSIASLIDDFRSPSVASRLNSMRNIKNIATALGPERTRGELLPYVSECIEDSDDVLCVLAEELGSMLDHVGGLPHVSSLLGMLETLACSEDVTIREKSAASLIQLARAVYKGSNTMLHTEFYSQMNRMTRSDFAGCRATSVSLIPVVLTSHAALNKTKSLRDILQVYGTLSKDSEPVVRRAVAMSFSAVLSSLRGMTTVDSGVMISEFLHPVFHSISQDAQDGIKLLGFDLAVSLANARITNDMVAKLSESPSWRVRYMAAYNLSALTVATMGQTHSDITLRLLADTEAEIRATTVCQLGEMNTIPQAVLTKAFKTIASDASPYVRSSMVSLLGKLVETVPSSELKEVVEPMLQVRADAAPGEESHDLDTTLLLVRQLANIVNVAVATMPSGARAVTPLIESFVKDSRWRVRERFLDTVATSMLSSAPRDWLETDVLPLIAPALVTDPVQSVRRTATKSWAAIIAWQGADWGKRVAIPILTDSLVRSSNYLHRVTASHMCRDVLLACPDITETVFPLLRQMASDPVPNVRLGVAEALGAVSKAKVLEAPRVDAILSQLLADKDDDVKGGAATAQKMTVR
eukprot:PhM_4_TR6814/c0_g1_i1/m.8590/K03456/PPP2R1; serine/threonine-protein phosphatase 2A regulatory subunit A